VGIDLGLHGVAFDADVLDALDMAEISWVTEQFGLIDVLLRCRMDSSVPLSTVLPARMMVARSHSASTSERIWLEMNTVTPRSRASRTHSRNTCSINGSSPELGSSSSSRRALEEKADISDTFCRLPLE
jgi:hypothetical protein